MWSQMWKGELLVGLASSAVGQRPLGSCTARCRYPSMIGDRVLRSSPVRMCSQVRSRPRLCIHLRQWHDHPHKTLLRGPRPSCRVAVWALRIGHRVQHALHSPTSPCRAHLHNQVQGSENRSWCCVHCRGRTFCRTGRRLDFRSTASHGRHGWHVADSAARLLTLLGTHVRL